MVAFVSQLVAPTPMVAAAPTAASAIATTRSPVAAPQVQRTAVTAPFELDPTDPNPFLFTMAPETPSTNADQLASAEESKAMAALLAGLARRHERLR